jgi:hypothetical protein
MIMVDRLKKKKLTEKTNKQKKGKNKGVDLEISINSQTILLVRRADCKRSYDNQGFAVMKLCSW